MSCGTAFSDQQSFSSLCRCSSKTGLPHFMISGGMPLPPGAFPLVRQLMAFSSSSSVVSASSYSKTLSWGMSFSATSVTLFFVPYISRPTHLFICLSESVVTSPVLDLREAVLDCAGPVAFFIPSNIPLMFPVSEQLCISVQSSTQYLFALHLADCCTVFLAFLRSSSFCLEGHCLYFSKAVLFAVVTGSISSQKASTKSAFFLFPNTLMAVSFVMLLM